jgi:ADP-heptose:LPS heptosyltransferase
MPELTIQQAMELGAARHRAGQIAEAVSACGEGMRLDANLLEAHNNLGNALVRSGAIDESIRVLANLDLIITVDTSVAHLAGAMGKPVWVLLPFVPDWRWMLARTDSPWYPTMRLFRQEQRGDWKGPIGQIVEAIAEGFNSDRGL